MRARSAIALLVCLLFMSMALLRAQESSDAGNVRALEVKWAEAYKQRQVDVLSSLIDDDFVITFEDGSVYGKVGLLSYLVKPSERIDSTDVSDLRIRMHGDIAVITGTYRERGESAGKRYEYNDRLTDVWMRKQGKWKLIASHYSIPVQQ